MKDVIPVTVYSRWAPWWWVGLLAGLLLGGFEASRILVAVAARGGAAPTPTLACVFVLLGAVGLWLGGFGGGLWLFVDALAMKVAGSKAPAMRARLVALLTLPGFAYWSSLLLSGRRVRALASWPWIVGGTALAGVLGVWLLARVLPGIGRRLRDASRWDQRVVAGLCLAIATAVSWVDGQVFVRRYAAFHAMVNLGVWVFFVFAVVAAAGGRRRGRTTALVMVGLCVNAGAGLSMARFVGAAGGADRAVVFEHGQVAGQLLGLASPWMTMSTPGQPIPSRGVGSRGDAGSSLRFPARDVILVTVDALRPDHLGAGGYARATSPNLDRVARRGVYFERSYATSSHTSYSIVSLMTGVSARTLIDQRRLEDHPTLADCFGEHGYQTVGFFPPAIFYVDEKRFGGLSARNLGFAEPTVGYPPEATSAQVRTDQVIDYFEGNPEKSFLWVHYFAPHEPYRAHPEVGPSWGERAVDRYDEEIRWVDREIGRLVAYLDRARPDYLLVLTADHGEEFGEHGGNYHGSTLFEEQIRVPLLFLGQGLAPRRVPLPVSTASVFSTLMAGLGLDCGSRSGDLRPWIEGRSAPAAAPLSPVADLGKEKMLVSGRWKLICDFGRAYCRLYDFEGPGERRDVAQDYPDRVRRLRSELVRRLEQMGSEGGGAGSRTGLFRRARALDVESVPALLDVYLEPGDTTPEAEVGLLLARFAGVAGGRSALRDIGAGPRLRARWGASGWSVVIASALGEPWALTALTQAVDEDAWQTWGSELRVRSALALGIGESPGALDALLKVLPEVKDTTSRIEVLGALGRTGSPEAFPALAAAYEGVRTRRHAVAAMGELGDARMVSFLRERVHDEPYISVRKGAAVALGRMGGDPARALLSVLHTKDPDAGVRAAAALGLATPVR